MSFANPIPQNNNKYWEAAAKELKCPTAPIAQSIKCMRTKSMDELLNVTRVENPLQAVLGHFGPNVDNKVVFGDYVERGKAGKFIQKPYLTGNNHFEAGLFVLIAEAAGLKISPKIWPTFNAAVFTCPIMNAADARFANKVPVWRYRYFGEWANTELNGKAGAYHTAEIPMVFGTAASSTSGPDSPEEIKVSQFMQKVWTQFAKDPKGLSKAPFNLPQYNPDLAYTEDGLIGFGANNLTRQLLKAGDYDSFCTAIDSIMSTIPGGLQAAIENVANGKDMGIPGMTTDQVPDMAPPSLPPAPKGAI
jgi:cholinesterase